MNKPTLAYPHYGLLSSNTKKWAVKSQKDGDLNACCYMWEANTKGFMRWSLIIGRTGTGHKYRHGQISRGRGFWGLQEGWTHEARGMVWGVKLFSVFFYRLMMTPCICQKPQNFTVLWRVNLNLQKLKKNNFGCQRIPGWNAECDKKIELSNKFMKSPHNESNEERTLT